MSHRFQHEAMATGFEVLIAGEIEAGYARQAASAAFRELDRLESELSRFVETSDIARVNRLKRGESTVVGEDVMSCLVAAVRTSEATSRAFDPAYASARSEPEQSLFALDPAAHTVVSLSERLHLDLGAVGKGYALDRMGEQLREWDIDAACLQGGGSTVLALAAPGREKGWPVTIGPSVTIISHRAVSASGTSVQGPHLIDPRTGQPASRRRRVWSFAGSAAAADALSTAFFVMGDAEIASVCQRHCEYGAATLQEDGSLRTFGDVRL